MTTITFYKADGYYYGFEEHGHTGYSEAGDDILCAALSSMTMLIINTLGVCLLGMTEAVGFGMWTTILLVPALTQNMIPLRSMVHQDSPYHGIGRYIIFA